jgi:peptide/nickel transport system permease protein
MTQSRPMSPSRRLLRRLFRRRLVLAAALVLALIILASLLAPWISPFDPKRMDMLHRLQSVTALHWFGTNEYGQDVFSRILTGGRVSLSVGLSVAALACVLGAIGGLLAGYVRRLDGPIMRLTDAMMAFPDILLAIALMAGLGSSLVNIIIALGVVYTPRVLRVARAATLVLREMQFVEAARALGVSPWRIMLGHILPNLSSPIIVQGTFVFAYAILTEAALSFLGVGAPPSTPSWGNMIAMAQQYIGQADWLIFCPGLAIVLTVLSLQIVGDGLRDCLDPRLQKTS